MFAEDMRRLVEICFEHLHKRKPIVRYLKERHIAQDTIDRFYLGAFPAHLDVLLKEFSTDFLVNAGVFYRREDSAYKLYSPFSVYPLIIPIADVNGEWIGIAGRTLLSEGERKFKGSVKYINSQYDKANHLFGLNHAKQSIRNRNRGIVVEGYFDVIASHQAGLENVIATLGTFLSLRQIMLLSRYCEDVKLLFDEDEAGRRAADRSVEFRAVEGIRLEKVFLPPGFKDIDEYIRKHGKDCNLAFV